MNVIKTTALLTLMTLIFLFTAQALGVDLISSLFLPPFLILLCTFILAGWL